MKLLILGGTVFLGRHIIEAALARQHEVTMLNRGLHDAGLFGDQVERLVGDRDGDLSALAGNAFDAVIDCSGYTPAQMAASLAALGAGTPHVVFVSTISVYERFPPGMTYDETAARASGQEGYGALKARAEDVLSAERPGQHAIIRPGLIVGPHDPTGRFTYWPERAARGGEVLAPGRPERPVQFIDVRDLALFCVKAAEERLTGSFNATGPQVTMGELLLTCAQVARKPDVSFTWIDDETLGSWEVAPWTELPLWLPEADPVYGGMLLADCRRAVAAGLTSRPVVDTVADTLAWASGINRGDPGVGRLVKTLSPEAEAEYLRRWRG